MLKWIETRTGLVSMTNDFLTEDVPGGASYWYVFGSATLFAMIVQIVTGIFLTFYYSPSAATAWESTLFIYQRVYLGQFIISLHYWGASAMIALVAMHLLQVLIWGAYKKPRELQWVVGVLLFLLTLVLGLTGYLLPWDLNAYFASQVAINIAGTVPILGQFIQQFAQDGTSMGTLTINRFFGIHVWLVPALLISLVALHLMIFRNNGSAGPPTDQPTRSLPQGRFWPNQMWMDAFASFIVFAVIVVLSIWSPAPLDAKADPSNSTFVPAPAWYFNALYALLEVVPDKFSLLATIVLPGVATMVLFLLPWIDRDPTRQLSRRRPLLALTSVIVIGLVGFSLFGQHTIDEKAAIAGQLPPTVPGGPDANKLSTGTGAAAAPGTRGAPGGGAVAIADAAGGKVYSANCSSCHGASGAGTPGAFPPLAKNADVTGDVKKVEHTLLYGLQGSLSVNGSTYNGQMPAWKGQLKDDEIAAVINYIRNSWGNTGSTIKAADLANIAK